MNIKKTYGLESFKPWGGAVKTWEKLNEANTLNRLEGMLEDIFEDEEEIDETKINDLLWFDDEYVYEYIGIRSLTMIENELQEREEELSGLKYDIQADVEDLETKEEKLKIFEEDYKKDFLDILTEFKELNKEWKEF